MQLVRRTSTPDDYRKHNGINNNLAISSINYKFIVSADILSINIKQRIVTVAYTVQVVPVIVQTDVPGTR